MKGFLRCLNMVYDYGHKLITLLDEVESVFNVSAETKKFIMYLDDYDLSLRYKDMPKEVIIRLEHISPADFIS